jgi:acetyl esterase/lipase
MTWRRAFVRVALLGAGLLAVAAPAASAKPVVLTIHGGGYYLYDAASMATQVASFEAQGFKVESVEYRLGHIRAGWRDVRAAVHRYPHRRVYAYGESAGAGYAGLLATTKLIDGAALQSPLIDLRPYWGPERGSLFNCTTRRCWGRFSAVKKRAKQPVLEFVPLGDQVASPAASLRWAKRNRSVRAITYPGVHGMPSPKGQKADLRRAGRFFWRHHCAGAGAGCGRGR